MLSSRVAVIQQFEQAATKMRFVGLWLPSDPRSPQVAGFLPTISGAIDFRTGDHRGLRAVYVRKLFSDLRCRRRNSATPTEAAPGTDSQEALPSNRLIKSNEVHTHTHTRSHTDNILESLSETRQSGYAPPPSVVRLGPLWDGTITDNQAIAMW